LGTVARLEAVAKADDGSWLLHSVGTSRFEITAWEAEEPYPAALVRTLPEPGDPEPATLSAAERSVRRALAVGAEAGLTLPRATFTLSSEPGPAVYELCALAPLGALDRQRLLEAPDHDRRLLSLRDMADEAADLFARQIGGR
jgi:Lon protease-like protein